MENGRRLLENMKSTNDNNCKAKLRAEAISCIQRGLNVTHDMEKQTIAALKKIGVVTIVAPYEADCQLAYLCHIGYCQAVMTEDSDILVYSAVCGTSFPILYKFDKSNGMVQSLELNRVLSLAEVSNDEHNNDQNHNSQNYSQNQTQSQQETTKPTDDKGFINLLKNYSGSHGRRMFIQTCIIAGCDYADSIHGVGLAGAQTVIHTSCL